MDERESRDTLIGEYIYPPVLVNMTDSARTAARLMASSNSSCAVVTLEDQPIGMITEWDLLTRVVILGRDPSKTPVSEVMSAPLWTIPSYSKIDEAVSLMIEKGFRRLVVKDDDKVLGLVSLMHLEGNNREASIPLKSLQSTKGTCPMCGKNLPAINELSEHLMNELRPKESAYKN
jgi:CBS domain-containing protein